MKTRIRNFCRRFFPAHYSSKAKCVGCGKVFNKSQMRKQPGLGWFCCESEAYEAWVNSMV